MINRLLVFLGEYHRTGRLTNYLIGRPIQRVESFPHTLEGYINRFRVNDETAMTQIYSVALAIANMVTVEDMNFFIATAKLAGILNNQVDYREEAMREFIDIVLECSREEKANRINQRVGYEKLSDAVQNTLDDAGIKNDNDIALVLIHPSPIPGLTKAGWEEILRTFKDHRSYSDLKFEPDIDLLIFNKLKGFGGFIGKSWIDWVDLYKTSRSVAKARDTLHYKMCKYFTDVMYKQKDPTLSDMLLTLMWFYGGFDLRRAKEYESVDAVIEYKGLSDEEAINYIADDFSKKGFRTESVQLTKVLKDIRSGELERRNVKLYQHLMKAQNFENATVEGLAKQCCMKERDLQRLLDLYTAGGGLCA